jgi:hypothetical protein
VAISDTLPMMARDMQPMRAMHRRVRQRPDGLLEIRRVSWRDNLMTRNPGMFAGLLVACVVCMSLLVACVAYLSLRVEGRLASSLLTSVTAVVVVAAVRVAGLTRCRPTVLPVNTNQHASKRTQLRTRPPCESCPTNACTTAP